MEKVKIKDHIKQVRGIAYGGNDSIDYPKEDYLPVLRSNNIGEGVLNFDNLVYVPAKLIKQNQLLKKGDIVITASTGSMKVIGKNGSITSDYRGSFGAFCKVVRPLESINPNYLKHFFQSDIYRKKIQGIVNGANINNIKNEHLDDLEIYLPELATQQKIAALLDKADELRQYNKQLVEKYDSLTQSLFLDMFGDSVRNEKGWELKQLRDIAKVRIGPFGSLLHKEDYTTNGIPLVNPTHIRDGKIISHLDLTISKNKMKELSAYTMRKGDLVLGRRGEMGRCATISQREDGYLCGTGSIFIRPTISIHPMFLFFVISSRSIRNLLEERAKGITMKNLNSGIVEKLIFSLPPIALQNQFADRVKFIEQQKELAQQALQKSEELFNSLLQKAFKGELILEGLLTAHSV